MTAIDGATQFAVTVDDARVWAHPSDSSGRLLKGSRYAALRLPRGETKSGAGCLTLDTAGRIYVASTICIQVFDPTGRHCGVVHPTPEGPLDFLAWEGRGKSQLTGWVGGVKFGRVMNVEGIP